MVSLKDTLHHRRRQRRSSSVARRLTYFSGVSVVVAFVACSRSDRRRRRRSSADSPRGDASGRGAMLQSTEVGKDVSRVEETTFEEEESI